MFRQFFAHPQERETVFYSLWYNAPKLMPAGGLERGGTDCVFGMKDVAPLSPSYRTHRQFLRVLDHRMVATWVHYTTSCKTQSRAPEDGQKLPETC